MTAHQVLKTVEGACDWKARSPTPDCAVTHNTTFGRTNRMMTYKAIFQDGLTAFYTGVSSSDCWNQMQAEHPGEKPDDWEPVYCVQNEA